MLSSWVILVHIKLINRAILADNNPLIPIIILNQIDHSQPEKKYITIKPTVMLSTVLVGSNIGLFIFCALDVIKYSITRLLFS